MTKPSIGTQGSSERRNAGEVVSFLDGYHLMHCQVNHQTRKEEERCLDCRPPNVLSVEKGVYVSHTPILVNNAAMSRVTTVLFPFDGACDGSKDADFTITFANAASLKANSRHLCEASSILRTALEEFNHNGTLNVGEDNREAWLLMLNLVHPGRRAGAPNFVDGFDFAQIEAVAILGQKYAIACVLDYVDVGLCRVIDSLTMTMPKYFHGGLRERLLSRDRLLFQCSALAVRFELEATKGAYAFYLDKILHEVKGNMRDKTLDAQLIRRSFTRYVTFLSEQGDPDFASTIAEKVSSALNT